MDERILKLGNALLGVAITADVLLTVEGTSRGYQEMNPLVRYLIERIGVQAPTLLGALELGLLLGASYFLMRYLGKSQTALFIKIPSG